MDIDALAVFAASCSAGERRELVRVLRTGHAGEVTESVRAARRRDGLPEYRGDAVRRLVAALAGRRWPESGADVQRWATISAVTRRTGVPGRTLRRWAGSGRVRARRAGPLWVVDAGDVERELRR